MGATGRRLRPQLRRPQLRFSRRRVRLAVALVAALGLMLLGGWFLLRDSSLVAVDHVTVTGADGPDGAAIRAALDSAARKMTTLDVQRAELRAAVRGFPEVKRLTVSTGFPHRIVIHVIDLLPVAAVELRGREVPVDGEGTLLTRVRSTASLPLIALPAPPTGARLHEGWALSAARLLSAAPRQLLSRLTEMITIAGHGLVAQIRNGPSVYFGDASQATAKWLALVAVLADPGSAGAEYIDVTDPARPVAGAGGEVGGATSAAATNGETGGSAAPADTAASATPSGG